MLLILGGWRHVFRRFPPAYDPAYWGAVFPLGMYTVCTCRLPGVLGPPFLALSAWGLTGFGFVVCINVSILRIFFI